MPYFCVSWTHKNTDLALRERLAFSNEAQKLDFLQALTQDKNTLEALVLSTCNRVEVFAFVKDLNKANAQIIKALAHFFELEAQDLGARADFYEEAGAIHHLFSVASSLDSLVIGETQIAGQLKDAFLLALNHKFCGVSLSRAVHFAFKCAAKVRNETQISKNAVSISSVAVSKAKELVSLKDRAVLVIGAGAMSELACKHLLANHAKITLLNRNLERAKALAASLGRGVEVREFSDLNELLGKIQLIFSATNAPGFIIEKKNLPKAPFKRYFFDIAVPRDINIKTSAANEVFAVDDLEAVARENLALREEQARLAYALINKATSEFIKDNEKTTPSPVIKALHLKAKALAQAELGKALAKNYLKNSDETEAQKLIAQVLKAFLHTPFKRLKSLDDSVQSQNIAQVLSFVFDLENKKDTR